MNPCICKANDDDCSFCKSVHEFALIKAVQFINKLEEDEDDGEIRCCMYVLPKEEPYIRYHGRFWHQTIKDESSQLDLDFVLHLYQNKYNVCFVSNDGTLTDVVVTTKYFNEEVNLHQLFKEIASKVWDQTLRNCQCGFHNSQEHSCKDDENDDEIQS